MFTYPLDLPSYHVAKCFMTFNENVVNSLSDSGLASNLSNVLDETWSLEVETGLITDQSRRQLWSAWRKALRGGLKMFVAYDVTRKQPLEYLDALTAADINAGWDGTAVVTSIAAGGALGLSGLPAGYVMSAGDRIGLEENGKYGYYEILETVVANGAGVASVTVSPFLHLNTFTVAAIARLWRPKAKFVIDWQSWVEIGDVTPSSISFKGWQKL